MMPVMRSVWPEMMVAFSSISAGVSPPFRISFARPPTGAEHSPPHRMMRAGTRARRERHGSAWRFLE